MYRVQFIHKDGTPQGDLVYHIAERDYDVNVHRIVVDHGDPAQEDEKSVEEQNSPDISEYAAKDAILLVEQAESLVVLQVFEDQENNSKARAKVLAAIAERRSVLEPQQ
jgi:hypothetical protein